MQQRRMQIMHRNHIFHGLIAEVVGAAVGESSFKPTTGQPQRVRVSIVIAATVGSLRNRQSPEFATPHHNRAIQQTSLFQIQHQRGTRLIDAAAIQLQRRGVLAVGVPRLTGEEQLDKAHTPLDQSPGDDAPRPVFGRDRIVQAVHPPGGFGFLRQIQQLGHSGLHSRGHFKISDASLQLAVARMPLEMIDVQLLQQPQLPRPRAPEVDMSFGVSRFGTGEFPERKVVPWNSAGNHPDVQLVLSIDWQCLTRIGQHDIRGQILIGGPQPITDPGTPRRIAGLEFAAVNQPQR